MPELTVQKTAATATLSHNARAKGYERREARQAATNTSTVRPKSVRVERSSVGRTCRKGSKNSLAAARAIPRTTNLADSLKRGESRA